MEELGRDILAEDWFTVCKEKFRDLSPAEKSSVILSLIDMCDTTARFNLLKSCSNALHCDILASMPQIALDQILGMLSVDDVLNACKVSHQWNKCISESKFVWKKKWLEMGIGSCRDQKQYHKRDWKQDCVTAQGLYSKIDGRKALDYVLDLFNDNYGYISAMDYCNGKLVLCHSSGEGGSIFSQKGLDWSYLCSFPVAEHGYPSSVRLLASGLIVVGSSNGKVTIWNFVNIQPGSCHNQVNLNHVCHGHTSIILSVDGSDNLGVVVSGSRDARVKVWSIVNGICLKTFDFSSPILQVSLLCGKGSPLKDYSFLLIHSSEKIILQSWVGYHLQNWLKDDVQEECIVTDANILPGIHIKDGILYYCSVTMIDGLQHTDFNCKYLNMQAVVGNSNLPFYVTEKVFSFQGIFRKLMQVGIVFALLIADDNITAIDIRSGSILFKEYVPYSAATSPALPQITVGVGKWLDGLLYVKQHGMVLALAIYGRNLTVISWAPSIPEFPSKED